MKVFLRIISVCLLLLLGISLGLVIPRLSQQKVVRTPTPETTTTEVSIYLIALGDEGATGKKIGCGDSLVAVRRTIVPTKRPLEAALQELLSLKSSEYGESGLYTALARSRITVEKVTITGERAAIYLTGPLTLGGACDSPRVEEQLMATALQFPSLKSVTIYLNSVPLREALSQK